MLRLSLAIVLVVGFAPAPVRAAEGRDARRVGMATGIGQRLVRLRQRVVGLSIGAATGGLARLGNLLPMTWPSRHGVRWIKDVPIRAAAGERQRLDIYRPRKAAAKLPIVLYVHGGGFTSLSRKTHRALALEFAKRGYLVFNVDYRLAPRHRYPAAVEDVFDAYVWVARNAGRYGGDLSRVVLAGESAGANLVTSLALATSYRRPEPWARRVFDSGVTPKVVWPAAPALQVSNPERAIAEATGRPSLVARDRLHDMARCYLGPTARAERGALELADPLVALERARAPQRSLPAFVTTVGDRDPLVSHARRLQRALRRLGARVETHVYRGEGHAFHVALWRDVAKRAWSDMFTFVEQQLDASRRPRPQRPAHVALRRRAVVQRPARVPDALPGFGGKTGSCRLARHSLADLAR